jgi:ankyrin repeat protein
LNPPPPPPLLLQDDKGHTPVHYAAASGFEDVLKVLLKSPKAARACQIPNGQRQTPLHVAAQNGHVACVRRLLAHDASAIDAQDGDGDTALHLAASLEEGGGDMIPLLLLHGAGVRIANLGGEVVFDVATEEVGEVLASYERDPAAFIGHLKTHAKEEVQMVC